MGYLKVGTFIAIIAFLTTCQSPKDKPDIENNILDSVYIFSVKEIKNIEVEVFGMT